MPNKWSPGCGCCGGGCTNCTGSPPATLTASWSGSVSGNCGGASTTLHTAWDLRDAGAGCRYGVTGGTTFTVGETYDTTDIFATPYSTCVSFTGATGLAGNLRLLSSGDSVNDQCPTSSSELLIASRFVLTLAVGPVSFSDGFPSTYSAYFVVRYIYNPSSSPPACSEFSSLTLTLDHIDKWTTGWDGTVCRSPVYTSWPSSVTFS